MRRRPRRKATGIEKTISSWLRQKGIYYRREYRIGFFNVDFYIPSANLVIQTDGCYWHFNNCKCNVGKKPTGKQLAQKERDKACNGVLFSKGYKVLRLKECDIINNWTECEKRILSFLKG